MHHVHHVHHVHHDVYSTSAVCVQVEALCPVVVSAARLAALAPPTGAIDEHAAKVSDRCARLLDALRAAVDSLFDHRLLFALVRMLSRSLSPSFLPSFSRFSLYLLLSVLLCSTI